MDPISAIFVMVVLTGAFAKGVDIATDGLLSAEVGGGVRGAGRYAVRSGRARWRLANAKARDIRMQSPQGRKVQKLLDLAGLFGRTLFGELRQFGSGVRSEWRTGRDQARSARTNRRGDAPWPATQWLTERAERARSGLAERAERTRTATPNEAEPNDPNGASSGSEPEPIDIWQDPPVIGTVCEAANRPLCERCGERPWTTRYRDPMGGQIDSGSIDVALGTPLRICGQCAREIAADRNGDPDLTGGKPWAHIHHDGCLHVTGWVTNEDGNQSPRYCGEPREAGWLLCPTHLTCPQEDIDEYRANPDHLGPDDYRSIPDPDTDPAPAPAMRGPSMDINSAPAAIAAWEAFAPRWESLQSRTDAVQGEIDSLTNEAAALHAEIATLADGMGDFAVGGEIDTAAAVGELSESATSAKEKADALAAAITTAKQAVDAHVDRLHDDFDPSIEAAAGQVANAHVVMQEA